MIWMLLMSTLQILVIHIQPTYGKVFSILFTNSWPFI